MPSAADAERWTIIAADGLALWRGDPFTREEALAHVAANPTTAAGVPQYAVPQSTARRLAATRSAIGERHEAAKRVERELAVRIELGLLAEAGIAVEREPIVVRYGGPGRGWYLVRRHLLDGFSRTLTLAGPFTSREQAVAEAERLRAAELDAEPAHSRRVGALLDCEPYLVVNTEAEPPAIVGTYVDTVEDAVRYLDEHGHSHVAPRDCVAIMTAERARAELGVEVAS